MEVKDVFEKSSNGRTWLLKQEIYDFVDSKDEANLAGVKVYFSDKQYYVIKDAEAYLASVGSQRVDDDKDADIIIRFFDTFYSVKELPEEVPDFILNYKKSFNPYTFGRIVTTFKVRNTEVVDLTEDVYRNLCELFGSGDITNQRIACTMLPTIKWADNLFLLASLFGSYIGVVRSLRMSQVSGFSKWASVRLPFWTRNEVSIATVIPFMEHQNTETIKYIKYIKNVKNY